MSFFEDLGREHKWGPWAYSKTPVYEKPEGGKLVEARSRMRSCKRCGATHRQYCRPHEKKWQDSCYIILDSEKEKCPL